MTQWWRRSSTSVHQPPSISSSATGFLSRTESKGSVVGVTPCPLLTPHPNCNSRDSVTGVVLDGRYKLLSLAGKGHFAKVYKACDAVTGDVVAVKMLGGEYTQDAKLEHMILQQVNNADAKRKKKVVRLMHAFLWKDNFCMVMNLLGPQLSKAKFGIASRNCTRDEVCCLAKQMAEALTFLHGKCALIHTDLKPENILLDRPLEAGSKGLGTAFTIADFGNAVFHIEGRDGTSLITTRPYRSPEVILKRGWRHPVDMWSLGCILFEVYAGKPLFDTNSNDAVHLNLITSKLGAVPGIKYRSPPPATTRYLESHFAHDPDFLDLMEGLLAFDPTRRMRAKEMCRHPFSLAASCTASSALKNGGSNAVLGAGEEAVQSAGHTLLSKSANHIVHSERLDSKQYIQVRG